jgi:hypothetical protein
MVIRDFKDTPVKQGSEIGVVISRIPSNLKQQLLLFDAVSFVDIESKLGKLRALDKISAGGDIGSSANDIEFLAAEGLIYETSNEQEQARQFVASLPFEDVQREMEIINRLNKSTNRRRSTVVSKFKKLRESLDSIDERKLKSFAESLDRVMVFREVEEFLVGRFLARKIGFEGHNATTLSDDFSTLFTEKSGAIKESEVVEIVLRKIPLPSSITPWEAILEFRSDRRTKEYLNGLRIWMTDAACGRLSGGELEQKLEWLLFQQSEHLSACPGTS